MSNDRHVRRSGSDYQHAFMALLPQGEAWPRQAGTLLYKVCAGLCEYWGVVDRRAADLLEQESDPRITLELLPDWERNWGLPDPCIEQPGDRNQALVRRMTLLGEQSREFFIGRVGPPPYGVAAPIGYTITITEYRVFVVGIDRCGDSRTDKDFAPDPMVNEWGQPIMNAKGDKVYDPDVDGELSGWPQYGLGPPSNRFYWTVHVGSLGLIWFRVGAGGGQTGVDPHLRITIAEDLACLLNRWKPAHTEIIFDYSDVSPPEIEAVLNPVPENSALGTVVGTFSTVNKFTGTPVYTLTNNAGGRFAITGNDLTVAGALDFEAGASYGIAVTVSGVDPVVTDMPKVYTVTVTNVAEPVWVTTFTATFVGDSPDVLNGVNNRQSLVAGLFSESGTKFRLTLQSGSGAEGMRVDSMYAGHAASGAVQNFDGTQVQITVGGLSAFTVPANSSVVTDPIDYAFDKTKNFLIAWHCDSAANDVVRYNDAMSGAERWWKTSASEASATTVTGYFNRSSLHYFIGKIEVWTLKL